MPESGTSEEKLTAGFRKVYINKEGAPESFQSFDTSRDDILVGYVVNLKDLEYGTSQYGKGYPLYYSGDSTIYTVNFGQEDADIYVFDAEFSVYYIKGFYYKDGIVYSLRLED